jgi:leader peptidase (prepilin peptidase)/N-methyltransferase
VIAPAIVAVNALIGAVVGSYVTTAALRATDEGAPQGPRSLCDGCHRSLSWIESMPLLSYVGLRGRCRTCAAPISIFHPAGEAIGLLAGLGIALLAPDPARAAILAILACTLLAASVIDARTRILPDLMVSAAAIAAAVLATLRGADALVTGLIAALVSLGLLGGLAVAYQRQRGQVGLGMGDVKLFSALALWLGLATPWMVLLAALGGLLIVLVWRPADRRVPLGPMIAAAGFVIGLLLEAGLWPQV